MHPGASTLGTNYPAQYRKYTHFGCGKCNFRGLFIFLKAMRFCYVKREVMVRRYMSLVYLIRTCKELKHTEHVFRSSMCLPLKIQDVFSFFSDAMNLEMITPPELCFRVTTPTPIEIGEGTLIDYRLRLFGVPFNWRARITKWSPPLQFVDEQILGPYERWVHIHSFKDENGTTKIIDKIHFQLPIWPFGEMGYPIIYALLKRIFRYRRNAIRQRLLGDPLFMS